MVLGNNGRVGILLLFAAMAARCLMSFVADETF